MFLCFRCWYSMKTRYVVLRTPKYFIVRCLFKFMRSCFVLLEIHSLFQIPLWKASFGGSCFFSIKNPNLRNIQIVFIEANVIFRVSSSKKTLWPLFMDRIQLPKVYRATTRRQFTFYHSVPKNSWYPFDQPRKDERLTRPWRSHAVVFNTGPLDWGSSALTNRPIFVFSLLIFNENEARYVILGTLTLLTIKNIINCFMCVGSREIFQGSALKKFISVLFFFKCIKKKHFRSSWAEELHLVLH